MKLFQLVISDDNNERITKFNLSTPISTRQAFIIAIQLIGYEMHYPEEGEEESLELTNDKQESFDFELDNGNIHVDFGEIRLDDSILEYVFEYM